MISTTRLLTLAAGLFTLSCNNPRVDLVVPPPSTASGPIHPRAP